MYTFRGEGEAYSSGKALGKRVSNLNERCNDLILDASASVTFIINYYTQIYSAPILLEHARPESTAPILLEHARPDSTASPEYTDVAV